MTASGNSDGHRTALAAIWRYTMSPETLPTVMDTINHRSVCGCEYCRETFALKVLADAVKSIHMTDKQRLPAGQRKPTY